MYAPACPSMWRADFHCLQVGKYLSRFAIKKKSGSPGPGMSMEASRIALLHARLQFFSAALFLDGPGLLCRQGGQPKINSLRCGAGTVTWRPP